MSHYNPFYFICKTTQVNLYRELEKVIDKLMVHFQRHRKITVSDTTYGQTIISLQEIMYIKSEKHYLYFYVANKIEPYIERSTLASKEEEINCPDFVKPHQRYLVNMNHIEKFAGITNTIYLRNNLKIPISKMYKSSAEQAYMIYQRR